MMKHLKNGIVIRNADTEDLRGIFLAGQEGFASGNLLLPFTPENIAESFMHRGALFLLLARKKKILGFIAGTAEVDKALINWIMVSEKFRNAGMGSALLKTFTEKAKEMGALNFLIDLSAEYADKINFLKKNGFTETGGSIRMSAGINQGEQ